METDVLAFGLFVHMYLAPSLYVYAWRELAPLQFHPLFLQASKGLKFHDGSGQLAQRNIKERLWKLLFDIVSGNRYIDCYVDDDQYV